MKVPSTWGSRTESCSAISEAGVIGYPAKNRHPAAMAPSAQASFPCISFALGSGFFTLSIFFFPRRFRLFGRLLGSPLFRRADVNGKIGTPQLAQLAARASLGVLHVGNPG